MLNIDEFTSRLEELFKKYDLTPSTFADKIGVQRSSISHLLSGRNKPSLDFVLKVQDVFPDIELNWLLHGEGKLERNTTNPSPTSRSLFDQVDAVESKKNNETEKAGNKKPNDTKSESVNVNDFFSGQTDLNALNNPNNNSEDPFGNQIDKIVIFYKNGTFKSFKPD